jgi:RNase adapter protein RapZ
MKNIVVITGMSGSGKSTAVRALEDAQWFCIDNLPAVLMPKVTELGDGQHRLGFVFDVREGEYLKEAPRVIDEARRAGHSVEVVFLDSTDEALTRRYSETRRRHPLSGPGGVLEGIQKERQLLKALREQAEHVIDTSFLTVHELRRQITARFQTEGNGQLAMTLMSFGFKHGVPSNADLVFDARFLPNPFFVSELKTLSGKDDAVSRFVLNRPESEEFQKKIAELLLFLFPHFQREGKSYLTVAIGCTGGKHRSVALVQSMAQRLESQGIIFQQWHRDLDKE